ncbi:MULTISPECIES: methyl-accepting chemotaxis protein [unclassified Bradyrhizobium]|uniref:methyl-accepting chemotaxis protein n=1 Tax=unclassified Bradyrhizobium TaxID=2631580 RepID=UPI001BA86FE3|nr:MULTISPECIES: methyl-accepting chemotaxis protein [unclassified Bradyrhizobium]MBR1202179.1 methyl-accepting chemotaxis protein [Bradyrhizobium sp. AUGA SZCCT0124]MBR1311252.1 methyl-accepting chemotaxis protein [Bradyrhizobium sp. AUGA SZCCT0051]MBR1339128.1 methyl-accepting chemotaxis protein [Bradyrhizobium sp. AUGA SZCCT0105]MBR1353702.1 methyl-accepting chemotaxis protein [Bradyrhizobium sp. AUGA SZCCT0045]
MMFLARFRILTKILAIVGGLSIIAGMLAYLGISSLKSLSERGVVTARAAERALLSAEANQNVLAINRAEFRSALDPRDENRLAARSLIDEQFKSLEERLATISKTQDPQTIALLPGVRSALSAYRAQLKQTLDTVESAKAVDLTQSAEKLRDVAMKSRAAAEELQARVRAVADRQDERVRDNVKASEQEYVSTSELLILLAASGVLLGLLFGFVVGQYGVAKPIRAVVAMLQQIANGQYDIPVHGTDRRDEVGDVAKTALVFKDNGLAKVRMEREQKEIEARAAAQRRTDMLQLADGFERAVGEIVETVASASTELEASATTLTSTAERSQNLATTVAAASEEATTNVQSVASATEELSSSVNEISRQVQESARMAGDAVNQARATNDRVGELSKAAARIGDVVELINTIAGQTNLLALNATIEAARAGEAGRGFAVVASEVKALAEQTAKATGEIGQQVSGIQAATEDSVTAIRAIGSTIERLSEISSAIAAAIEEQGAATQEISRNVQQAAQGTQQVSANITDVQHGANETGSASTQVLSAAQSLSGDSSRLKLEVGKFLNAVRAA